jgi:hypothetical protein
MPFSSHVDESTKVFHVEAIGEVNDTELTDGRNPQKRFLRNRSAALAAV